MLRQFQEQLKESGVPAERILSYNLEAKSNQKYTTDPDLLHDAIVEKVQPGAMNYVFIDEVQLIPEFGKHGG